MFPRRLSRFERETMIAEKQGSAAHPFTFVPPFALLMQPSSFLPKPPSGTLKATHTHSLEPTNNPNPPHFRQNRQPLCSSKGFVLPCGLCVTFSLLCRLPVLCVKQSLILPVQGLRLTQGPSRNTKGA